MKFGVNSSNAPRTSCLGMGGSFSRRQRVMFWMLAAQIPAQRLEQTARARLATCSAVPELIEEHAVLGVGEAGMLLPVVADERLELPGSDRRGHVDSVDPHVIGGDDAHSLDDVGVGRLVSRDRT